MKKVIVLSIVLCVGSSLFAYSGGDGSTGNPYQIANVSDFQQLSASSGDWSSSFILTADIDLSGRFFVKAPIGQAPILNTNNVPFTGIFEGNGHVISNLSIYSGTQEHVGLFGWTTPQSQIRNLGVENVLFSSSSGRCIGGLVGNNNGILTSCYATGTGEAFDLVGGLVGANNGTITSCYANVLVRGYAMTGGLVGANGGSITSSYAIGTTTGTSEFSYVGGLVGYNTGRLTGSGAASLVSGSAGPMGGMGGLVGWNANSSGYYNPVITSCFWDKPISTKTVAIGTGSYPSGITGYSTTDAMKKLSVYTSRGWDFQNTWYMPENSYPILAWQVPEPASLLLLGVGGVMIRSKR